jgi:hypothetical protein
MVLVGTRRGGADGAFVTAVEPVVEIEGRRPGRDGVSEASHELALVVADDVVESARLRPNSVEAVLVDRERSGLPTERMADAIDVGSA